MPLCPDCGAPRTPSDLPCPRCGAGPAAGPAAEPVGASAHRPAPSPVPVAAEPHAAAARLDPEAQRRVISRFFRDDTPVVRSAPADVGRARARPDQDTAIPRANVSSVPSPPRRHIVEALAPTSAAAAPPIKVHRSVPGSGEWWDRRLHSAEASLGLAAAHPVAGRPKKTPPPPPPRLTAVGAASGNGAAHAAVAHPRAVAGAPSVSRRRDLFGVPWLRADRVTAVMVALALVIAAAFVIISPNPTARRDDEAQTRSAVVVSPPSSPSAAPSQPSQGGVAPGTDAPPEAGGEELPEGQEVPPEEGTDGVAPQALPAEELLEAVNSERRSRGRPALVEDEDLTLVAELHVGEMVDARRLFHTSNAMLSSRVTNWQLLAESIGVGPDVPSLMDAFLRSDVDRLNLLDPSFGHVGVGAVKHRDRLWVTLLFTDQGDPETPLSEPAAP